VGGSGSAWFVNFINGGVFYNYRYYDGQVRLVRASQ
jgi:hypothetical protein